DVRMLDEVFPLRRNWTYRHGRRYGNRTRVSVARTQLDGKYCIQICFCARVTLCICAQAKSGHDEATAGLDPRHQSGCIGIVVSVTTIRAPRATRYDHVEVI